MKYGYEWNEQELSFVMTINFAVAFFTATPCIFLLPIYVQTLIKLPPNIAHPSHVFQYLITHCLVPCVIDCIAA